MRRVMRVAFGKERRAERCFRTTHWSAVLAASDQESAQGQAALARLPADSYPRHQCHRNIRKANTNETKPQAAMMPI